jgi:hypothetical protein
MTRLACFTLALMFVAGAATAAPTLDAAGKCRDAGKFVATAKCKPAAKPVCKDAKGKFAKCSAPGAVPMKK